jgi:MFS family permease
LAGGIYNVLGTHGTIYAGCSTKALYAAAFLYYNHNHNETFAVIAGGILGVGSGLLWAGQGSIMTSYPTEDKKGRYISLFWSIFNLGGVIGGFVPFILNYHTTAGSVSDGTYIGFMCFMASGAFLSLALLPPSKVVRSDGSRATLVEYSNVSTEAMEIIKLFFNWKMLLLFPSAWAGKFSYTYLFNNVNGKIFTVRTRGLNNVSYWGAQILGSVAIGYVLDFSFQSRKKRGFLGVAIVAALGTAIWGGGLANQLRYSRDKPLQKLDLRDSGAAFAGPFVLYFSYGLLDSMFQTVCYWTIAALADDSHTLTRYSGFYKAVQSAGAVVAWHTDKQNVSLLEELIINWSLSTISYPFLIILIALAVDDGRTATAT